MKNQTYRMTMLYDFYGELLTDRQKEFFDLYYNEDLSLGEIAENNGISRQGVFDNLSRAEALLKNMEAKTGCASRDQACRKAAGTILEMGRLLQQMEDPAVSALAEKIISAARGLEE